MMLSDSVSLLYQQSKTNYLAKLPEDPDPSYYSDLIEHLNKNDGFREDRRKFRRNNPHLRYHDATGEHLKEYLKYFNKDIIIFSLQYKDKTSLEVAQLFCSQLKGYSMTYGQDLIERAISRARN